MLKTIGRIRTSQMSPKIPVLRDRKRNPQHMRRHQHNHRCIYIDLRTLSKFCFDENSAIRPGNRITKPSQKDTHGCNRCLGCCILGNHGIGKPFGYGGFTRIEIDNFPARCDLHRTVRLTFELSQIDHDLPDNPVARVPRECLDPLRAQPMVKVFDQHPLNVFIQRLGPAIKLVDHQPVVTSARHNLAAIKMAWDGNRSHPHHRRSGGPRWGCNIVGG